MYELEFIKPVKNVKLTKRVGNPSNMDVDDTWDEYQV